MENQPTRDELLEDYLRNNPDVVDDAIMNMWLNIANDKSKGAAINGIAEGMIQYILKKAKNNG